MTTASGIPVPNRSSRPDHRQESANLADILERVLDKGIVIAGDIRINLLDIELLTIKIRLLVASVDKAREMGIDWWEHDTSLSSGNGSGDGTSPKSLAEENRRLRERIEALEAGTVAELEEGEADEGEGEPVEEEPVRRTAARRPQGRRR